MIQTRDGLQLEAGMTGRLTKQKKENEMKKILATTLIAAMSTSVSMAAVINEDVDDGSTHIGLNGAGTPIVYNPGEYIITAGDDNSSSNRDDESAVLVFQLPNLAGETISDANLSSSIKIQWPGAGSYPLGLDLYGVRYSDTHTVLASDYLAIGSTGNGTLIQDDVVSLANNNAGSASFIARETSASGDAALVTWLTDQYTAGATAGNFVFLRFTPDASSSNPWQIASFGHTTEATPVLTIETIPEPATIGLVAAISGALLFIRRRFMI